jgi:hypothetical protein
MQVVCGNCQLNFEAPDGAAGLVCPICRSPLRPEASEESGGKAPPEKTAIEWSGGTLDDLISLLSGPALSARVEVFSVTGGGAAPLGEVHLLAGGVADALHGGQSTDDALDKLRAVVPARFKIEARLPNPANGDLSQPGPEAGTLEGRPLAHLMRYCEEYVISCGIEVWRGNENARVDYRRGEINGVTVGGIDAPERLAEVMQWASGNYRLIVPPIALPPLAPKRPQPLVAAPASVPAPAPSAQSARTNAASATRTMFGIPVSDVAAARAAAEAAAAAIPASAQPAAGAQPGAPAPAASAPPATRAVAATPPAAAPPPSAPLSLPGLAPSAVPSPLAASRASATKTIFGVPAPSLPRASQHPTPSGRAPAPAAPAAPAAPEGPAAEADSGRIDRKTGARKVAVPAPEIVAPVAAAPPPSVVVTPAAAAVAAAPEDAGRATQQGYDSTRGAQPSVKKPTPIGDKTVPTRVPSPRARETPLWAYVGLGFTFGLALLAIYQLVGRLAH